jgi:hypothetical protein
MVKFYCGKCLKIHGPYKVPKDDYEAFMISDECLKVDGLLAVVCKKCMKSFKKDAPKTEGKHKKKNTPKNKTNKSRKKSASSATPQ